MSFALTKDRKMVVFTLLVFLSLVIVLLPTSEAFASYRYVANNQYKTSLNSSSFKYIRGGLGMKVSCSNGKGKTQTMYLQRLMSGKWVTRGTRTVYCSYGVEAVKMKYNYYYIPDTVSGQTYRLRFVNSDSKTTTSILAEVNPN